LREQVACTLTPHAKKGNPKAAPNPSPRSMSLQQPRVLNQRGAQQTGSPMTECGREHGYEVRLSRYQKSQAAD
jgi:hypothetical protein